MTKSKPSVLIAISELADFLDITPQRLRQVLTERGVPRPTHGMVDRAAGIQAYLRTLMEGLAKQRVANMVDDPVLQGVFEKALIRHWRGFDL